VILGVVPLVACGQRLDMTRVEDRIQADLERQGRRLALREVRCPNDVTPQVGAFFRCVGELDPEGTFTINVTQQDDLGTVTWDVPNSKVILNLAKVEAGLQQGLAEALGQRALVDCGEAIYRVNQPGDRFECRVVGGLTDGDDSISTLLVTINATGNLNWQELRDRRSMVTTAVTEEPTRPQPSALPADSPASSVPSSDIPTIPATSNAVKQTTTTGPTGRVINRPYIPGDND
jgi:hypothetical protein